MFRVDELTAGPLRSLGFELAAGECLAVIGPSGCGKTTLLRALADLDAPSPGQGGQVWLAGRERASVAPCEWREQVRYFAAESGWWADRVGAHFADWPAARRWWEPLGIPAAAGDWPVARLSSGERQRLALARGLERPAQVLLLDEPTRSLDPVSREAVERMIAELLAERCALWVTHDAEQAQRVSNRQLDLTAYAVAVPEAG